MLHNCAEGALNPKMFIEGHFGFREQSWINGRRTDSLKVHSFVQVCIEFLLWVRLAEPQLLRGNSSREGIYDLVGE